MNPHCKTFQPDAFKLGNVVYKYPSINITLKDNLYKDKILIYGWKKHIHIIWQIKDFFYGFSYCINLFTICNSIENLLVEYDFENLILFWNTATFINKDKRCPKEIYAKVLLIWKFDKNIF